MINDIQQHYKTIDDWIHDNSYKDNILLIDMLKETDLTNKQILTVLTVIGNVCMDCYDNIKPCHCNCDE